MLHVAAVAEERSGFGIQVIDEATGRGVPMVMLRTRNEIDLVTDSAGWVVFDEPGLLGRRVFFSVRSPGYVFAAGDPGVSGLALDTRAGTTAEVKVMRADIAERMYRATGQGIYREATRLGLEVPLPRPNLNGEMVMHGSAQAAMYRGKLFWVWCDAAGFRGAPDATVVAAATSDFSASGGLDPSLGIHFEYLSERGVFANDVAGSVRIEGLLSVLDAEGHEHLLAHYERRRTNGARVDHGIAEFNDKDQMFEPVVLLGNEFTWQFPQGHAVKVMDDSGEHFFFAAPFCMTRVPAQYEDIADPSKYEALSWSGEKRALEWQKQSAPLTANQEEELLARKEMGKEQSRVHLRAAAGGKSVPVVAASVEWNRFRNNWVMIATEGAGAVQTARIWFAEAAQAYGPWGDAVCVADMGALSLSDPLHHAAFDQEDGKRIYFDVNVQSTDAAERIPRYNRNRLMLRLDLGDRRLGGR